MLATMKYTITSRARSPEQRHSVFFNLVFNVAVKIFYQIYDIRIVPFEFLQIEGIRVLGYDAPLNQFFNRVREDPGSSWLQVLQVIIRLHNDMPQRHAKFTYAHETRNFSET